MADEKDKAEKPADDAPAGPKKIMGLPLLQFVFVAVNILVVVGSVYMITQISLLYKKPAITDAQVVQEIQKKVKKVETGDGFFTEAYPEMMINLKGPVGGKLHIAQVETAIVCGSEACIAQLKENKARIEDAIQGVISQRSYTELGSLEVKFRVKHEILNIVNGWLKNTAATDVLFTSFTVN